MLGAKQLVTVKRVKMNLTWKLFALFGAKKNKYKIKRKKIYLFLCSNKAIQSRDLI